MWERCLIIGLCIDNEVQNESFVCRRAFIKIGSEDMVDGCGRLLSESLNVFEILKWDKERKWVSAEAGYSRHVG